MTEDSEYYYWDRGQDKQIGHFKLSEFTCKCTHTDCLKQRIAKLLVDKLNVVREQLALPIAITSGFRCHQHQLDLAKAGYETANGLSQHELGRAADIFSPKMSDLVPLCNAGFMATGVALRFIHCDLRADKPRRWTYQQP